jgi:hypothetical protein
MEKEFIIAICITALFVIMKIVEIRWIDQETPPLKYVVRDAIKIFFSALLCSYLFSSFNGQIKDFVSIITDTPQNEIVGPPVFTDEPGF